MPIYLFGCRPREKRYLVGSNSEAGIGQESTDIYQSDCVTDHRFSWSGRQVKAEGLWKNRTQRLVGWGPQEAQGLLQ